MLTVHEMKAVNAFQRFREFDFIDLGWIGDVYAKQFAGIVLPDDEKTIFMPSDAIEVEAVDSRF